MSQLLPMPEGMTCRGEHAEVGPLITAYHGCRSLMVGLAQGVTFIVQRTLNIL